MSRTQTTTEIKGNLAWVLLDLTESGWDVRAVV
jgi:hypothetical protein